MVKHKSDDNKLIMSTSKQDNHGLNVFVCCKNAKITFIFFLMKTSYQQSFTINEPVKIYEKLQGRLNDQFMTHILKLKQNNVEILLHNSHCYHICKFNTLYIDQGSKIQMHSRAKKNC